MTQKGTLMKSYVTRTAVFAIAALTAFSASASAETFNSWIFKQMATPSTRTRAEVRAEVLQGQTPARRPASGMASDAQAESAAVARQNASAFPLGKEGAAPQAATDLAKSRP